MIPRITSRSPLQWRPEESTPLPADTIVTVHIGGQTLEIRHKGAYRAIRTPSDQDVRLTVEPRLANEVWIRVEPER